MRNGTIVKKLRDDIQKLEQKKTDTIAAIDAEIAQKRKVIEVLEPPKGEEVTLGLLKEAGSVTTIADDLPSFLNRKGAA